MWDLGLVVFAILFTNVVASSINILMDSTTRSTLRDEITKYMTKANPYLRTEGTTGSFNLCQPGVERAAICEAVATLMDVDSMAVENNPCTEPMHLEAAFPCKTAEALLFNLTSNPQENTIRVDTDREIIHRTFEVPANQVQLVNADYVHYIRTYNWLRLAPRTGDEIGAELKRVKLPALYETAIQLTVESVKVPFTGPGPKMKGFNLCAVHINKGLLCQAINVHLYGESNFIPNKAECNKGTHPYFDCEVRFVGSLRMVQGIIKKTIFLLNSDNEILYIVTVPMLTKSLENKYAPSTEPKKLPPVSIQLLPAQPETDISKNILKTGKNSQEMPNPNASDLPEGCSSHQESAVSASEMEVPQNESNPTPDPSEWIRSQQSPQMETPQNTSESIVLGSSGEGSSQSDASISQEGEIVQETQKSNISVLPEGYSSYQESAISTPETKIPQHESKPIPAPSECVSPQESVQMEASQETSESNALDPPQERLSQSDTSISQEEKIPQETLKSNTSGYPEECSSHQESTIFTPETKVRQDELKPTPAPSECISPQETVQMEALQETSESTALGPPEERSSQLHTPISQDGKIPQETPKLNTAALSDEFSSHQKLAVSTPETRVLQDESKPTPASSECVSSQELVQMEASQETSEPTALGPPEERSSQPGSPVTQEGENPTESSQPMIPSASTEKLLSEKKSVTSSPGTEVSQDESKLYTTAPSERPLQSETEVSPQISKSNASIPSEKYTSEQDPAPTGVSESNATALLAQNPQKQVSAIAKEKNWFGHPPDCIICQQTRARYIRRGI